MPLSKNGKLYYTDEQYKQAKYNTTALQHAQRTGMQLVQQGNYFISKEHDSLVFTPNGKFFWNSHNLSGDAVDFVVNYEQKTFVEAILEVAGETEHTLQSKEETRTKLQSMPVTTPTPVYQPTEFKLPEKADNCKQVFGYLCQQRKIDNAIVSAMVHEKRIFQSKEHNNAIFVSFDINGVPVSAFQRGTLTFVKESYKRDVVGSKKFAPFVITAVGSTNTAYIFEGAIDALSHATLTKYANDNMAWRDYERIAIGGVTQTQAIDYYLQNHPNIKNVCLCLDNDPAGIEATAKIGENLANRDYNVSVQYSTGKDWNDDLLNFNQSEFENNKLALLFDNQAPALDIDDFEMSL